MGATINNRIVNKNLGKLAWSLVAIAAVFTAGAQTQLPNFTHSGFQWRNIGPFRGGRISAVSGVIGQPGVFYVGLPMGGVWKTTDAGVTWNPIFDSVKDIASIGSVAVAPSDPNIIYAGTGDMIVADLSLGNGMYKSVDAGKTWAHIGLDGTNQIPCLLVDPKDPNIVLAATQGPINKKSDMRGIFRSTDGGKTWTKTLFVDDETGAERMSWDPNNPNIIFATTDQHYRDPKARFSFGGRGGNRNGKRPASKTKLYESTDEGVTWKEVSGGGLPELEGRTSVAVAMHTNDQRIFVVQNAGLWRTEDGGKSWEQMDKEDPRVRNGQGGYNCGVYVNTADPNTVYVVNTCLYVSHDDGKTFTGLKGAPGGDDPQQMWIDPTDGNRILLGMDQGATISYNGGKTWSLWYNQPTGQFYHISVDNRTPYWVYGTEQDSGSIGTSSRGILGEITPFDWTTNPGYEFGTIVADPLNPNIVYAGGPSRGIVRAVFPSGQWVNVSPNIDSSLGLREVENQPLIFSYTNPHELFAGFQYLMATTDGGIHWKQISPDLTHPKGWKPPKPGENPFGEPPEAKPKKAGAAASGPKPTKPTHNEDADDGGDYDNNAGFDTSEITDPDLMPEQRGFGFGSIECIAPSRTDRNLIWVGTSNGLIKLTKDGGHSWEDVSIPKVPGGNSGDISAMDASPFDPAEAYAAVDTHGANDDSPHFFRTTDYGKTWTEINNGIPTDMPSGSFSRVIRCDTEQKGLLFAGTESSVYVSLDDGNSWQSLAINLPNTSYRDLVVHGNDLVAGTYGRAIWVLDDITPLRQLTKWNADQIALFQPEPAMRVRRNVGQDTPFPPEVPHALNPPQGAVFDYSLPEDFSGTVNLVVKDSKGNTVRILSSSYAPAQGQEYPPEPNFWLAKRLPLPAIAGFHRVVWSLRYAMPPGTDRSYEINANPGQTPPSPRGPMVLPGNYTVTLEAGGKSITQPFSVFNDPRSPGSMRAMQENFKLQSELYNGSQTAFDDEKLVKDLHKTITDLLATKPTGDLEKSAKDLDKKLTALEGSERGRGFFFFRQPGANSTPSFSEIMRSMESEMGQLDTSDMAPNEAMMKRCKDMMNDLTKAKKSWSDIQTKDWPALQKLEGK